MVDTSPSQRIGRNPYSAEMLNCYGRNTRQFGKKLGPNRVSVCPCQRMDNGKQGMKRVEIKGLNDKRLITAVFADGYFFYLHKLSLKEKPIDVYH